MDLSLLGLAGAFGLAASAGLNTTLPLLIVGLFARGGLLVLVSPFDALTSPVALVGLAVLAAIELIGDKIPVIDTAIHAIQLPLVATAGAILFASQTATISWVDPGVAIIVGLLTAGGVHAVRAAFRPAVTAMTMGLGNVVVSIVEDVAAVGLTVLSVLAPIAALIVAVAVVAILIARYRRSRALRPAA